MWGLLSWLWDRAQRVYEFLGSLFYRIRSAAINAWTWARNAKDQAISWAATTILYYYNRARAAAAALVNGVIDLAWVLYNRAVDAARAIFAGSLVLIDLAVERAIATARVLVNAAIDLSWVLYNRAVEAARQVLAGVLGIIAATVERAYQALVAIINGSVELILAQLEASGLLTPENQQQLRLFLGDPVQWFFAYLCSLLLMALEGVLAYALGSVETTLPPAPTPGPYGYGGPIPYGPGPSPGSGAIAPPVKSYSKLTDFYRPGHRGLDIAAPEGTIIFACHDGKVSAAGWSSVGYGNQIIISGGEWWTRYAHLSQINVGVGQVVKARDPIGRMGCTGNSTCSHLHLEVKQHGNFIDPLTVLAW